MAFLGKYGLLCHINGTEALNGSANWARQDYSVLSWIYSSIFVEIMDFILEPEQLALDAWMSIEELFHHNKESQTIFIEAEFQTLVQGGMLITDYFNKLKTLIDALRDVGQPFSDKGQVLNMLRGLNPFNTSTLIPNLTPFSTFLHARSLLHLEEVKMKNDASTAAVTALLAIGNSFLGGNSDGSFTNFDSNHDD